MNRTDKEAYVQELSARLQRTPFVAFADYRGVTVAEINAVRRRFEAAGMSYVVVKNALAEKAIAGTSMEAVSPMLTGMTGWVFSGEDPVAAAKLLRESLKDFAKTDKFKIKGGYFDGEAWKGEEILKVADLPSREELLASLLATMQEAPRQVLGVIQGPARDLLYLLSNYATKLEEDSKAG